MKKGIIFDLDGTLWDTTSKVVPAWNIVLKKHGVKPITQAQMQSYMGKTLEDISQLIMPEMTLEDSMKIMNVCCIEERVYLSSDGGILYPKLEDTLEKLKKSYNIYLVSNCLAEYLNSFFTAHKLKKYFDDFETYGNTGLGKTDNIRLVLSRNKLDKAVYVGDTVIDKDSAAEAEIPFIYAAYGFGNLENEKYAVQAFADIPSVVEKII